LTDLAGYRVHYGTTLGNYTNTETINDPNAVEYVVDNLTEGTWFFTVTAFDAAQNESDSSNVASKTIDLSAGP
jgi:hypothetical protein